MLPFGVRAVETLGKGKGSLAGVDVAKLGVDLASIHTGKGMLATAARDEAVARIGFGIGPSAGVGVVVVGSVGRAHERRFGLRFWE